MKAVERVFLIGCFQLSMPLPWYRKLAQTIAGYGLEVTMVPMPTPRHPRLEQWMAEMHKHIKPPWDRVALIGHSIGAAAVLQFAKRGVTDGELGGMALVACGSSFKLPSFENLIHTFVFDPQEFTSLRCKNILMINGTSDVYAKPGDCNAIASSIGARLVMVPGSGHFGLGDSKEEQRELPASATAEILRAFGCI